MAVAGKFLRFLLIFTFSLTTVIFLNSINPEIVSATDVSKQYEQEKKTNESRIQKLKAEISRKRKEKRSVKDIIWKLDQEEYRANREITKAKRDLDRHRADSAFLAKQLRIANDQFNGYKKKHQDRLVAYYKNGTAGYMEVLFNSTSFSDFISRVYYLQLLTKHDLDVMNRIKALQEDVNRKKILVEQNASQVENKRNELVLKKRQIDEIQGIKNKELRKMETEENLLEEQVQILERENREIEERLRRAQGSDTHGIAYTGTFGSPLCGRRLDISSRFGYRKAPRRGASTYHRGVDLRTPTGTDICAAADGVVFESSYETGYGNYIVIRHGSNYATVYGHGSRRLVSTGDQVHRGQVIMKSGSTGISTGPHLHFEIRKNGTAIDPLPFLR